MKKQYVSGMENELRSILLMTAGQYSALTNWAPATVSRRCRSETGFFTRIAKPENSFTVRTFDEVMGWFADNWPADADLPSHLRRYVGTSIPVGEVA